MKVKELIGLLACCNENDIVAISTNIYGTECAAIDHIREANYLENDRWSDSSSNNILSAVVLCSKDRE